MVVLGASRFDAVRAIAVQSMIHVDPASPDATADQAPLFSPSFNSGSALATTGPEPLTIVTPGGKVYRKVRTEMMEVTAYCACPKCCGKNARGITASGKPVSYNNGRFVAAPRELPFGTKLRISEYYGGEVVEVIDRGGAIKGNKLDVYFSDHNRARRWGRQRLPVEIVEEMSPDAGGEPLP